MSSTCTADLRDATYDLGQVEGVAADGVEDQILQLVDGAEEVLAEGSHDDEGRSRPPLWRVGARR